MTNTETALREVTIALAAVEEAMGSSTDSITANQLKMARQALQKMQHSLTVGVPIDGYSDWLGQMVADQWDPAAKLTEAVLRADRVYSNSIRNSTPR